MADNVRYVLDKMAPLFKQLEEMDIFTNDEIKSIVKRRTDFEYTLKRRQLVPGDFSQYLNYELALDKLCNSRSKHYLASSKENIQKVKNIQAAFIRHITYIFERAIRRFSDEVYLWMDFIRFLKSKESNTTLNTVYARALALHPKNEVFWIECAMHEVEANANVHAARTILQRGIRANKGNKTIWLKYFELELWNAVRIIERQRTLGLEVTLGIIDEGAPLVVFKHAIEALSNHGEGVESILQMHTASEGILDSLSEAMEDALREKFSTNVAFWRHLMKTQVDRMLYNNKNLSGSAKTLDKKRKYRLEHCDIETTAEKCAAALSQPIGLLMEAQDALSGFTDDDDQPLPLSGDFLLMAVQGLDQTLVKCNQSMAYAVRYVERQKAAEEKKNRTSAAAAAPPAKKAKRGKKAEAEPEPEPEPVVEEKLDEEEGVEEEEEQEEPTMHTVYDVKEGGKKSSGASSGSSSSSSKSSGEKKSSAKEQLTRPLEEINERLKGYTAAIDSVSDSVTAAVLRNVVLQAQYHLWLFASRLHISLPSPTTTESLVAAVLGAAAALRSQFKTHNTPGVHKDSLNQLVESLIDVVKDVLHTPQLSDAHRSVAVGAVISVVEVVASSDEAGAELISIILTETNADQIFQAIISQPSLNSSINNKGVWCARYLQFTLQNQAEERTRAVYEWVLTTVQKAPQLFVGADLSLFFNSIISHELKKVHVRIGSLGSDADKTQDTTTAASTLKKSDSLTAAKAVVNKAVKLCSGRSGEFTQLLIELERLSGHHQAANHLAWKVGQGL